jgi:ribosomal protein L7/L12
MKWKAQDFALGEVLNLYRKNIINELSAIYLLRGIIRGLGIKEAKEILNKKEKE